MTERATVHLTGDGLVRDNRAWTPDEPWVGTLDLEAADRRPELLTVAAQARTSDLAVVDLTVMEGAPEEALTMVAALPTDHRPRGLLLGERWQEAAARRCDQLTGAAGDLGLADAVRLEATDRWQGHHLLAGAVEAFLAQVWAAEDPPPRAVILGDGPTALAAALAAARRGTVEVLFVATDEDGRRRLAATLDAVVNWPPAVGWQVAAAYVAEPDPAGLWLRADAADTADAMWLPDAAGTQPCLLVDLVDAAGDAPVGCARPDTGGIQIMAAGLAAAWYLGPPIPWDDLTAHRAD